MGKYRIGADVGGTFTDLLLMDNTGNWAVYKTPSTPANPAIGFLNGLQEMADQHGLPLSDFVRQIDLIVHGTTVTTNAVLTQSGATTALLTTRGFRDVLQMRRGVREELYNNRYQAPEPIIGRDLRFGVAERVNAEGEIVQPLDKLGLRGLCAELKVLGVESMAVCFMHSYKNADNELSAAAVLSSELPGVYVTLSSELLPQIGAYDRVSTTALNSYVGPILQRYLLQLIRRLDEAGFLGNLLIMQSNGGVTSPEVAIRRAVTTLLSGPAAGPIAGVFYTSIHGLQDCITVDMGGTSFDVAMVRGGQPLVTDRSVINRFRVAIPTLEINTIGAGGGSIGWVDPTGLLRMGPASAGALPGPACYGRGGQEPTCTDANVVLGYLSPEFFLGGKMPLNFEQAYQAIERRIARPLGLNVEQAAAGMYRIININMASAIRETSIEQGIDPREYPLVAAGGAGPIHAGMIALELEIPVILVPRHSSIFCASGMLMSDLKHDYVRSAPATLSTVAEEFIRQVLGEMIEEGRTTLIGEGLAVGQCRFRCSADLRYLGQHHEITVDLPEVAAGDLRTALADSFHQLHDQLYGYHLAGTGTTVEMISLRVTAIGETVKPDFGRMWVQGSDSSLVQRGSRRIYLPTSKDFEPVPVYAGDQMPFGARVVGPALVEQVHTTIFVPPDYDLTCDRYGSFILYLREKLPRLTWIQALLAQIGTPGCTTSAVG